MRNLTCLNVLLVVCALAGCGAADSNATADARVPFADAALPTPDAALLPTPDAALLPTPDAAQPTPDAAQPTPDAAQPTPDAAQPTPDAALPTPDAAQPTPDAAQPTPDAAQPSPDAALPDAAQPAPDAAPPVGACGDAYLAGLAPLVVDLLYPSESDYPLDPILGIDPTPDDVSPDDARRLQGVDGDTLVEVADFAQLEAHLAVPYDPSDPYIVDRAQKFAAVFAYLRANLHDLTVLRVGEIEIHVYVLGHTACGELAGFHSVSIET